MAGTGGAPFDIVDVFRRPEYTPDIARVGGDLGSGTLWLQQRVVNWEAAEIAHEGGLRVVMDRCTAIDHRARVSPFRAYAALSTLRSTAADRSRRSVSAPPMVMQHTSGCCAYHAHVVDDRTRGTNR